MPVVEEIRWGVEDEKEKEKDVIDYYDLIKKQRYKVINCKGVDVPHAYTHTSYLLQIAFGVMWT